MVKSEQSLETKVNDPVVLKSAKPLTLIEDSKDKKPHYTFEDPVSMKSPTFEVLANSAKSRDDDFEPIAKLEVSP